MRSLSFQLNFWYSAVFFGSLALLALVADYRVATSIENKDREIVTARLREYKAHFDEGGLPGMTAPLGDPDQVRRESFVVRVSDAANQTVFLHVPDPDLSFDPASVQVHRQPGAERWQWLRARAHNGSTWIFGTLPLGDGLWLQVGRSNERSEELLGHLRAGFAVVVIIALLLGLLGGTQLTQRVLRPVRQFADITRSIIRSGDQQARVPTRGSGDELDELGQLFNRMLERNQGLIRAMREALDNVAHDLRTPLTHIRGVAELALGHPDRPQAQSEALADCIEESDRLLAMLQTLMDISEAETGAMRLDRQPVDLCAIAAEVAELYAHVAQEREITLTQELPAGMMVSADRSRLRRVVANLVDNALKYTPPGGAVTLRVSAAAGQPAQAELQVNDTGMGISAEDQPRVWERLYRADHSRSQRGLGLGLSFVRAIVQAHGGRASVESQPGQGARFTVRLPAAANTWCSSQDSERPA